MKDEERLPHGSAGYRTPLETNAPMIAGMRLLLASIVLIAYLVDIPGDVKSSYVTWSVAGTYLLYSLISFFSPAGLSNLFSGRYAHWVDVGWYGLLTAVTDPFANGIFLFFLFAILTASFRYGHHEGRNITIGCALLYLGVISVSKTQHPDLEWTVVFLRAFFLVSLGYMIAHWGGTELALKRRLALLREINELSNPRFGVEQILASTMQKLRDFFDADTCMALSHDAEMNQYVLRETSAEKTLPVNSVTTLPAEAANLLLPFERDQLAVFGKRRNHFWRSDARLRLHAHESAGWIKGDDIAGENLANTLNTSAYISAPLQRAKNAGRIYLTNSKKSYSVEDALFFAQAVEQAFRLIEHVQALDRLASAAASQERQLIAGDLHDTAIQPYIGLKMGLEALRAEAEKDNPLSRSLDALLRMTNEVIDDLRHFISNLKNQRSVPGNLLLKNLEQKARQFFEFYGIEVGILVEGQLHVSDRLASELLQIVNEGLSNIRKHTAARQCQVRLALCRGILSLQIENPCSANADRQFVPRSISTRVSALGGNVDVAHGLNNQTVVNIKIPT